MFLWWKSKWWFDVVSNAVGFASRCVVEGDDKNKYLFFSFKPKCQNLKNLNHITPSSPGVWAKAQEKEAHLVSLMRRWRALLLTQQKAGISEGGATRPWITAHWRQKAGREDTGWLWPFSCCSDSGRWSWLEDCRWYLVFLEGDGCHSSLEMSSDPWGGKSASSSCCLGCLGLEGRAGRDKSLRETQLSHGKRHRHTVGMSSYLTSPLTVKMERKKKKKKNHPMLTCWQQEWMAMPAEAVGRW